MTQRLADRLRKLVLDLPKALNSEEGTPGSELSPLDRQLLRMLKTEAEKASKGRAVRLQESMGERIEGGGVVLSAMFKGWHAQSVANQVAKSFRRMRDVESAEVKEGPGKKMSVVVVRPIARSE